MFSRIVIAVDGSDHSKRALGVGAGLAKRYGAQVIIVHAFEPIPSYLGEPYAGQVAAMAMANSEAIVREASAEVRKEGVEVITEILQGPPADAILRVAESREADLIVVGSRGLGRLTAHLLGSTSDKVLHHARCHVLVVK